MTVKLQNQFAKQQTRLAKAEERLSLARELGDVIEIRRATTSLNAHKRNVARMSRRLGAPLAEEVTAKHAMTKQESLAVWREQKRQKQIAESAERRSRRAAAEGFYRSEEWRRLRYQALVKHGNRCLCCGASPLSRDDVVLHVDHIKPRSIHPELEWELDNLQILCEDCNLGKSNEDDTDFRT